MVLNLKDICLNYIAKEFDTIPNFNSSLLDAVNKETIIERLINHNLLDVLSNKLETRKIASKADLDKLRTHYQSSLIKNFFNGYLDTLRFNGCSQVTNDFLRLIKLTNNDKNDISKTRTKLHFRSVFIRNCSNLTGLMKYTFFLLF